MESVWSVSKSSTESVGSRRELVANCAFTPPTPTRQNSFVASASAMCIGHKIGSSDRVRLQKELTDVVFCRCSGTAVESQDSKDDNPAIINVGDSDGRWNPGRGRPGGRYGNGGGRLADVVLEHPSPLGPTSARLQWDVSSHGAQRRKIDGFHVKYRPVLDAERGRYQRDYKQTLKNNNK